MIIEAVTPTRIDLAGGTLDIYPLYLFEDGGITVNMGIDVHSFVRVETRSDSEIHLISEDTGARLTAPDIQSLPFGGDLDLVARIVKFYAPAAGVTVITRNSAPRGSGLGASSALLIALSGALNELNKMGLTVDRIIDIGANLEAQSIRVPTGKQDYYAAAYGGVNAIWFEADHNRVERLVVSEAVLQALEERIVLTFTSIPHFSAITNWGMMKSYIDNSGTTVQNMKMIKESALHIRDALLNADFDAFARLLDQEWQNRKNLAAGVTTPEIDKMIADAARHGALASKICGAGGGGCMITFIQEARREEVIRSLESNGARYLPFRIDRQGFQVKQVEGE